MASDAEFVNVVFDPTFSSFDADLDNINLANMMNISYSEEVLQKNFTTLINILKQLHKGMLSMGSQLTDSKDWIQVSLLSPIPRNSRKPRSRPSSTPGSPSCRSSTTVTAPPPIAQKSSRSSPPT